MEIGTLYDRLIMSGRCVPLYANLDPLRKELVRKAVYELAVRYAESPSTWLSAAKPVRGVKESRQREIVWEVDLPSAGDRLLLTRHGDRFVILMVGDHDTVPHYAATGNPLKEVKDAHPLPTGFMRDPALSLFQDIDAFMEDYMAENHPKWFKALAPEQGVVFQAICERAEVALSSGVSHCAIILGPGGSGKTAILLNLLEMLLEWEPRLVMAEAVSEQLERATGLNLGPHLISMPEALVRPPTCLLVDDPPTDKAIKQLAWDCQKHTGHFVLAVADPVQFDDAALDKHYRELQRMKHVSLHHLSTVYRQKENPARLALNGLTAFRDSTAFGRDDKVRAQRRARQEVLRLATPTVFPNPGGRTRLYQPGTLKQWKEEVEKLRTRQLWTAIDPLLVVIDDEEGRMPLALPQIPQWLAALKGIGHRTILLTQSLDVKGLDFQHCFMVLTSQTASNLLGAFMLSGSRLYQQRQSYLIPLARPKDSVVWFVTDERRPLSLSG